MLALAGGDLPGAWFSLVVQSAPPSTTSLSPRGVLAGGAAFTLTVTGTNFVDGALVRWNGGPRPTVVDTRLGTATTTITATDIATVGTAGVSVSNPDGGESAVATFWICGAPGCPSIPTDARIAFLPTGATAGGSDFSLTVNGGNFVTGARVRWNGAVRATTFVSATQLTGAISAADIAAAGSGAVTVVNPDGSTSNAVLLPISACSVCTARSPARFTITTSTASTNAGVLLTATVTALLADGTVYTSFTGTIRLTSTDAAFAPGTGYRYQFVVGDAGRKVAPVTFNTAGNHTLTVTDQGTAPVSATNATVAVAETVLHAVATPGTIQQGAAVTLTVQAKTVGGALVCGYRGSVRLSASWNSVRTATWGAGVDFQGGYAFTAADAGSHSFTPIIDYAGSQTITVTDQALAGRAVTTAPITVTNTRAAPYAHEAAPSGVTLADGSVVWAFLGSRGQLLARRNAGTVAEPAWRPVVTVREPAGGTIGADSPSLLRFGGNLVLFHSFTDGTYYQVWRAVSADNGETWGAPVQVTAESGHVQRVQAVVDGGTLYLFWSRQDSDRRLFYQSTTNLTTWSGRTAAGQLIGPAARNSTSNFGIVKLSSGRWLLGWIAPSGAGEAPAVAAGDVNYPTVQTASSADLATWSAPVELTLAASERWPKSVALAQDAAGGAVIAAFEGQTGTLDSYVYRRTSADGGATWTARTLTGYKRSGTAGRQGYRALWPAITAGGTACAASVSISGLGELPAGLTGAWNVADAGVGVVPFDCLTAAGGLPMPYGEAVDSVRAGAVSGAIRAGGADLGVAARAFGLGVARSYSSFDALLGRGGAFGPGWSWSYGTRAVTHRDGSVSIAEADGRRATFWKTGTTFTPAAGIRATLTAAGGGYTLTRRSHDVWQFDAAGRLTSVTDRNGNVLSLSYAAAGAISGVTAPGGRALSFTSDAQGRITRVDGPAGLNARYTYDAAGMLATATDASGKVTTYRYDTGRQLTAVVDGRGVTTASITPGGLGRAGLQRFGREVTTRNGVTTVAWLAAATPVYAPQGYAGSHSGMTTVTNAAGAQSRLTNDATLRPVLTEVVGLAALPVDPRQPPVTGVVSRSTVSYTATGEVASVTDGTGAVSTISYDAAGNLLSTTVDAGAGRLNLTTTMSYSGQHDLLTVTNPLGESATFTYDSRGNRLTSTSPLGHVSRATYDASGLALTSTDPTGRVTAITYNAAGDAVSTLMPGDTVAWTRGYDAAGRAVSATNPLGQTTTTTLDGMGRTLSVTTPLGLTTTFGYDGAGLQTSVTSPWGWYLPATRTATTVYDALGRVSRTTDPAGGTTTYTYDGGGNLVTLNRGGYLTTTTPNAAGQPLRVSHGLGSTHYEYDLAGRLVKTATPRGEPIRQRYDGAGRLVGVDLGDDGVDNIRHSYDAAGRRTAMAGTTYGPTPVGAATTFVYDAGGRVTRVTAPDTGVVTYEYDTAGRRTRLGFPSGHAVSYGYSARGELATVTDWVTPASPTRYQYDAAGRRTRTDYPNATWEERSYDADGRLTRIGGDDPPGRTPPLDLVYGYDRAGNRASVTRNGVLAESYAYDAADRLTYEGAGGGSASYTYDRAGNRTSVTVNGVTLSYTVGTGSQVTAAGATSYGYDAAGNRTSKTAPDGTVAAGYYYDALGRLTAVVTATITTSYQYNADGLRVSKALNGTVVERTAWDLAGGLGVALAETSASPNFGSRPLVEHVYGLGHILAELTTITGRPPTPITISQRYSHTDALRTARTITMPDGAVAGSRDHDAFGAVRAQSGEAPATGAPARGKTPRGACRLPRHVSPKV